MIVNLFGIRKAAYKAGYVIYFEATVPENGVAQVTIYLFSNFPRLEVETLAKGDEKRLKLRFESKTTVVSSCYSHLGAKLPEVFHPIALTENYWLIFVPEPYFWNPETTNFYKTSTNCAYYVSDTLDALQVINREMQMIKPETSFPAIREAVNHLLRSVQA